MFLRPRKFGKTLFTSMLENYYDINKIDEYDHFANELLGFNTNQFKNLVSKNEKVRKWYEILKKGADRKLYYLL